MEEQWAIVDAIVAPWKRDRPTFPNYEAGTWGPAAADELVHRDGRSGAGTDDKGVTIRDVERELGRLRAASTGLDEAPRLRTSVMTHIAWVPERWVEAVQGVMSELGERHRRR